MNYLTINLLKKLLVDSSIAASKIPKSSESDIDNLVEAGVLSLNKSGAGKKLIIREDSKLKDLLGKYEYSGEYGLLTEKAKAVFKHKNAHHGRDESLHLQLSGSSNEITWRKGDLYFDVGKLSSSYGLASLMTKPTDLWITDHPIILVENFDLLQYANLYMGKINLQGTMLYYSGWLCEKLITWLTYTKRTPGYLILPDYDLVGLSNYIKAKEIFGDLIDIYVPDNLENLLDRYGNIHKLNSQTSRNKIENTSDEKVLEIYNLFLKTGKCLDQEALLLDV